MYATYFLVSLLLLYFEPVEAAFEIKFSNPQYASQLSVRSGGTVDLTARSDDALALGGGYFADITIGNPPQKLEVQLDTGSSDFVIVTPDMCNDRDPDSACVGGQFDPSLSHSYTVEIPNGMNIGYDDTTRATGDYSFDDVSFAGITLRKALLSVATKGNISTSLMGIGPNIDFSDYPPVLGPTTLDALISNHFTDSKLFSVWLDDDAASGSILFGGIDESKFDTGAGLVTIDMVPDPEAPQFPYSSYMAAITSMSSTIAGKALTYSLPSQAPNPAVPASTYLPMCIDTGTSTVVVPNHIFNEINIHIGTFSNLPAPDCNALLCSQAQNKTLQESTFSWTIGDPKNDSTFITYSMSFADLVIPALHPTTRKPYTMRNPNGDGDVDLCIFGLQPIGDDGGDSIMGVAGMKRMYVVFDQDHKQLSFGKPILKASGTLGTPVDVPLPSNSTIPQINGPTVRATIAPTFNPSSTLNPLVQLGSPSEATHLGDRSTFALVVGMFVTFVCSFAFGPVIW